MEYMSREDYCEENCGKENREGYKTCKNCGMLNVPSADVQPVKHGRWECVGHDDTTYWYRCSVCGHEEHDNMTKHDSYCSNCGARMDLNDGDAK